MSQSKKRALGKGLEALLGGAPDLDSLDAPLSGEVADGGESGERLRSVSLDLIDRSPWQPRRQFEPAALQELADSIRAEGLIQPIVLRARGERYELVAGERRWRAAQLAQLHAIPAIVRSLDDRAAAVHALVENIQRQDLNPLEQAQALSRLIDEFGLTHSECAARVGRSRAAVSNALRLLDLSAEVQALLAGGQLDMGHARALVTLGAADQLALAQAVIGEGLSVRATEARAKALGERGRSASADPVPRVEDPNIRELARELSESLGARVKVHQAAKGRGRLEIAYDSLIQLDGILQRLR